MNGYSSFFRMEQLNGQGKLVDFQEGKFVPPGSTIVVPRDLRPFDFNTFSET